MSEEMEVDAPASSQGQPPDMYQSMGQAGQHGTFTPGQLQPSAVGPSQQGQYQPQDLYQSMGQAGPRGGQGQYQTPDMYQSMGQAGPHGTFTPGQLQPSAVGPPQQGQYQVSESLNLDAFTPGQLQPSAVGPPQQGQYQPQDLYQFMGQAGPRGGQGQYQPLDMRQSMGQAGTHGTDVDMNADDSTNIPADPSDQAMAMTAITTQPTVGAPSSLSTTQQLNSGPRWNQPYSVQQKYSDSSVQGEQNVLNKSTEIQAYSFQGGHQNYAQTQGEPNVKNQSTEHSTIVSPDGVFTARHETSILTPLQKPTTQHSQEDQEEKIMSGMEELQTSNKTQDSQDVAEVHVQIDWPEKDPPSRWDKTFQKSLQTFFNRTFQYPSYEIQQLHFVDFPFSANISVHPASAYEALLKKKSATLTFRDRTEGVTVHFNKALPVVHESSLVDNKKHGGPTQKTQEECLSQEIPMTVSVVVDLQKCGTEHQKELQRRFKKHLTESHTLQVNGTFEEVEQFYKELSKVIRQPGTSGTNTAFEHTDPMETSAAPLRVPLFQYWYLNHTQREEIEHIQKKHGVEIKSDVSVSIEKASATNSQACTDASQEFTDLFQKHAADIISVSVPSRPAVVKDIVSLDSSLMLHVSSGTWSLVGPRPNVNAAQRAWNLPANKDESEFKRLETRLLDQVPNRNLHAESRWKGPKGIEMNIKDPLMTNGLCINNIHWELMKKAFKKQIKDLKNKFDVDFQETTVHGNVTVHARSVGNQTAYLEVNALRALMSLYQKVVTTAMSCPLQNASHTQTESVKNYLRDINTLHPSLAVMDEASNNGVWMLIGLPNHLCFAISQIEEKLGGSAFDKKHKEMIECEQNAKFLKPCSDGPELGIPKGYEQEERRKGASFGGALYENVREQGGADQGAEERRAIGSSVDGAEDWEKRAGSAEARNGDHRALAGAKDGGGSAEDDNCPICMDEFNNKEKLSCGHAFCKDCLRRSVESLGASCPVCKKVFGKIEGDQPRGTMTHIIQKSSLPGFKRCDTIVINYNIPSGIQSDKHPKPGRPFHGAQRTAYLPDSKEGREVLALLQRAFQQRLIFTVGTSRTSGMDDCVTWNDIHHKTTTHGGPQGFGYPDDGYLNRVRDELKAKGIDSAETSLCSQIATGKLCESPTYEDKFFFFIITSGSASEPHYKSPAFKKHDLMEASAHLQEKICCQHGRLLEMFCRTDQTCVCMLCTINEHRGHDTVSITAESNEKKTTLQEVKKTSLQQIQEREKNLRELRNALASYELSADAAVQHSEMIFGELLKFIKTKGTEVNEMIRDQQGAAVSRAEPVIKRLEEEIAELRQEQDALEQLSHEEDNFQFLQSFKAVLPTLKATHLPSMAGSPSLSFNDPSGFLSAFKQEVEKLCIRMQEITTRFKEPLHGISEFKRSETRLLEQAPNKNLHAECIWKGPKGIEMRVPLFQYWYLNHTQREEIEHIQKKHGVEIKSDVSVSIEKASATNSQACTDASQEFTDLFQKYAADIISVPVPSRHAVVKDIVSLDPSLMLHVSSGTWSLVGPRPNVNAAQRMLNLPANKDESEFKRPETRLLDQVPNKNLHAESRWKGPKGIEMNINDPLMTNGLRINHIHWELMKKAFKKQIKDLKNKFDVDFQETTVHDASRAETSLCSQIATGKLCESPTYEDKFFFFIIITSGSASEVRWLRQH
ncbi:hypothetical protein ACEWY4_012971 [Coilia grayii]|uniref:RING-type E3 ubiquitin transferase n=1 Tax=Coilia grayii TaxID=363190 RepID=A0ABD1JVD9_9TELE